MQICSIEGRESIAVPDLIIYEVTNVLRFKKGIKEEIITEVIPFLFDISLEIIAPSIPRFIKFAISVLKKAGDTTAFF